MRHNGRKRNERKMKRILLSAALGVAAIGASASAFARTDIGVFFGVPGPVYEAPPPVYYAPPPPVVYEQPAPVYYGPYYGDGYRREWHGNRWHHHHHHDDDDD